MEDIARAKAAQAEIKTILSGSGTNLVHTPVERLASPYRERVLQVQIFILTDAVAQLTKAVEELRREL